jgi:hypothetical protein
MLAEGSRPYADLAREAADFTGHILGQSLDLMDIWPGFLKPCRWA